MNDHREMVMSHVRNMIKIKIYIIIVLLLSILKYKLLEYDIMINITIIYGIIIIRERERERERGCVTRVGPSLCRYAMAPALTQGRDTVSTATSLLRGAHSCDNNRTRYTTITAW